MKKKIISLVLLFILIFSGVVAYNYLYQDHRDIKSEISQIKLSAPVLLERFKSNDGDSLLNKTVTVTGTITHMEDGNVSIDESVYASFAENTPTLDTDEKVEIKGRCIGYDELFEIVKLDQCSLLK